MTRKVFKIINLYLLLDTQTKTGATLDLQKEKTSMICTVKNRLKKKIDIDIINKKGPMKAILPIGNMQKRGILLNK